MKNCDNYFINQLNSVCVINCYNDGKIRSIAKDDAGFDNIIDELSEIFDGCKEMPAFGVSLHNDTVNALKYGVWIELLFDKVHIHNGMQYERLLINLIDGSYGFNIIRYYDGKYEGRCFYIDLNNQISTQDFKIREIGNLL